MTWRRLSRASYDTEQNSRTNENFDLEIIIKGYTDNQGDYAYNKMLSEFRAKAAQSYLIDKGVLPSRIKAVGMGPAEIKENTGTVKDKRWYRRVEIRLNVTGQG